VVKKNKHQFKVLKRLYEKLDRDPEKLKQAINEAKSELAALKKTEVSLEEKLSGHVIEHQ